MNGTTKIPEKHEERVESKKKPAEKPA